MWRVMWFSDDPEGDVPHGGGSAHAVDGGYASDPVIVRRRGIGFFADLRKPVVRVRCGRRDIKEQSS